MFGYQFLYELRPARPRRASPANDSVLTLTAGPTPAAGATSIATTSRRSGAGAVPDVRPSIAGSCALVVGGHRRRLRAVPADPVGLRLRPLRTAGAHRFAANFFDLQARAFLDGDLAVPTDSLGIEGFVIDGRTFMYFPPFPALLRIPVLMVTDGFDGR